MSKLRTFAAVLAVLVATGTLVASGAAITRLPTTPVLRATALGAPVMTGLDNPRGLAFGPEGGLYVAEAGHGGSGPCIVIRGETQCAGASGAVSSLWHGVQNRIVTGLASYAPASGQAATGPSDVSLHGRGNAYVTIGLAGEGDPLAFRELMGDEFGRTVRFQPNGNWREQDDIASYEAENNPDDSAVPDSNPFGILARPGGRVVVDAAGNDLLDVRANGSISTLAVFPSRPQGRDTDSDPTSVAVGPDGAYYVGELTGSPFATGAARVYRVEGGQAQVYLSDFTAIIDIGWGPDGNLYVLQFATGPGLTGPGVLLRVNQDGTRSPVATDLIAPGGFVFGPNGAIYISNKGVLAGQGEVLRFGP